MSLKSYVKSKKQKLHDKKFSKGSSPAIINVVSSSEDEHYPAQQKVQKRSKYSGKPVNASNTYQARPYIPHVLDLKKISAASSQARQLADKVIYQSSKVTDDSEALLVVETEQQNPETISRDRSLFSYKVDGKQGIKYVSETHIKGRINSQIKDIETKKHKKIQKQQRQLGSIMNGSFPSDNQQNFPPAQRKRAARYFQDGQSEDQGQQNVVKCFRCLKKGHIAKNCLQQQPKQCCNFCQLQHHHSVCDSIPCFRCCQPGHISQDCPSNGIECRKCNKHGHRSEWCGIYVPLDYNNKDKDYVRKSFKKSDLKKLECLRICKNPEGHFNCFVYQAKSDVGIYANNHNQRRSEIDREVQREKKVRAERRMYGN